MSVMYVYLKDSKCVIGKYSSDQNLDMLYHNDTKMLEMLGAIYSNNDYEDYKKYKVIDKELVRLTDVEIEEMNKYEKILSEDERTLNKLKPTHEEVKKAETTIGILSLMMEVL